MIGAAIAMLLATGAPDANAAAWATYRNVRYGYSVCYPRNVLRAGAEALNGDGRSFEGRNGSEVQVYGSGDPDRQGVVGDLSQSTADRVRHGAQITYRRVTPNWGVISGRQGNSLFYRKVVARADQLIALELTYPASLAAFYAPVVARMSRCLSVGNAPF
jgi:hypothetical protein